MPGLFDDLIPQQSDGGGANPFADLIPVAPQSVQPEVQAPHPAAGLPAWMETAHSYLDPTRVLTGQAGKKAELGSPIADTAAMLSQALPAGVGRLQAPTSEALHMEGEKGYAFARRTPVAIKGQRVENFVTGLKAGLKRKGFYPISSSAEGTHSILDDVRAGGPFFSDGKNLSATDYIALRQALQKQAQNFSPNAAKDQAAASMAIDHIDRMWDRTLQKNYASGTPREVAQVKARIKDARANFAAGFRSDLLAKKQYEAELSAAAANSGKNIGNRLRQKTEGILTKPKSVQGYSPEEVAALEKVVTGKEGLRLRNTLRNVSGVMGGSLGFPAAISGGLTGGTAYLATGNPWALTAAVGVPVTGVGLRLAEAGLTKSALNKIATSTRLRSPLGAAMKPPVHNYSPTSLAIKLLALEPYIGGE